MSASDRSSVTVRIAGEEHTIRSTADPDYTRRCAEFVDSRILEIRKQTNLLEEHKTAILAALSITDQYLQARDELDALRREVVSRARNLESRISEDLD
jgi:cell division protein ZapA (FtsZ GTPase activity inhibitor)